jgi:RNA recognition motif-containing protein
LSSFWCIRRGSAKDTKGTAFVVYEDIFDAKTACEHLSGFNVAGRYLVVLYYQQSKAFAKQVRPAAQYLDHLPLAVRVR